MNKEYYEKIFKELDETPRKKLYVEHMDIICAGTGKTCNRLKYSIFLTIKKHGIYYCNSYIQSLKTISQEQREKISKTLSGRKLPEETKNKISEFSKKNESYKYMIGHTYKDRGLPNPRLGKITSEETKQKIREANTGKVASEEARQKMSESKKNYYASTNGMKKETKEKLSKMMSEKIANGEYTCYSHTRKTTHHSLKSKNEFNTMYLKSSYEKYACIKLDNDENCKYYAYEMICIPYYDEDNNKKFYTPDFIVNYNGNINKMIEVKPRKMMNNVPINQLKKKYAEIYCKENNLIYEHWDEDTLEIKDQALLSYEDNYYKNYSEFVEAVRRLNIKTSTEYRARYKEDPCLPSSPADVYPAFSGWHDVIGKHKKVFYETYEEAKQAAIKLNCKNKHEYFQRYKEDPKLHCAPEEYYCSAGWEDYIKFLGNERNYYSYEEALDVVQKMQLKSVDLYKKDYRLDSRLPSKPNIIYKDKWVNWKVFLNNI